MPDVLEEAMPVAARTPEAPSISLPSQAHLVSEDLLARRALLSQIERLESEFTSVSVSAWPRKDVVALRPSPRLSGHRAPCLLSLGELEEVRDDLAHRAGLARRKLGERLELEEQNRLRIEKMLLEPERHKWVRVGNEDIGQPGCRHWHVRPRWGLLGMLMNWWRVRISSGCPLPQGLRGSR